MKKKNKLRLYACKIEPLADSSLYAAAQRIIPSERCERAERFRQDADIWRCLAAGLLLVHALAETGFTLEQIRDCQFRTGEHGKPYLQFPNDYPEEPAVFFNLSHSGSYVICSVASVENGCDVEQISRKTSGIAEHFFPRVELDWILEGADEQERAIRFARVWTIKESYLKAIGKGLSEPLDGFYVLPDKSNQIIMQQEISPADAAYYFKEYTLDEDYCCSVCSPTNSFEDELTFLSIEQLCRRYSCGGGH